MEDSEKKTLIRVLEECLKPTLSHVAKPGRKHIREVSGRKHNKAIGSSRQEYVCIDCEMVSTDADPNALARVSLVDFEGNVLLDEYVKPNSFIKNFKTQVSGIKPGHMRSALPFDEVRSRVLSLIEGKVLVGHAVANDLRALKLELDPEQIRDTQKLSKQVNPSLSGSLSLKKLAILFLGKRVQKGSHSSVEDARTTMEIFKEIEVKKQMSKHKRHKNAEI